METIFLDTLSFSFTVMKSKKMKTLIIFLTAVLLSSKSQGQSFVFDKVWVNIKSSYSNNIITNEIAIHNLRADTIVIPEYMNDEYLGKLYVLNIGARLFNPFQPNMKSVFHYRVLAPKDSLKMVHETRNVSFKPESVNINIDFMPAVFLPYTYSNSPGLILSDGYFKYYLYLDLIIEFECLLEE